MIVDSVKFKKSSQAVITLDCSVGDGYIQTSGGSLPDVDCDFASDRRQDIKEYLERRYNHDGKQRVFSAGTLTTLKLKACIKDIARTHRVPVSVVNYITAIFEDNMSWTDLFKLAYSNKKVHKFVQDNPIVIEEIRALMGQPRSASIHASAIIVTPDQKDGEEMECFDFTPIKKVDGVLISELDGYSIDDVGLLKNDILGTKELAKLKAIMDKCNEIYGANISLESIVSGAMDDEDVYKLLSNGFTQNVFQFSSRGMTKFLMDLKPRRINDLIAANALYRPATLESGSTEKYVDCHNGDVAPVYLWGTHNALKDTYGLLTYQEQISTMAKDVGNFSLGDGVRLMKIVSKKKADKMAKEKDKFLVGAKIKGCPDEDAIAIWHMIESGASYLFNKSHATAYAITSYVGAYLKMHYPSAFYTVALQWAKDDDIPALMSEMEQCSTAKIVKPDINVSGVEFFTDYSTDEIFWSLTRIKQVGVKAVDCITAERKRGGAFTSIENFIHRIFKYKLKKYEYWDDPDNQDEIEKVPVNARHVRNLIIAGCFDEIECVGSVVERYAILTTAAHELGFELKENEFPSELIDKHYFWTREQVNISGIGSVDYRRIYDNSDYKDKIKGKARYMSLKEAAILENEGKRISICATLVDIEEKSYKDKTTGKPKTFCKIKLQQNNDIMEMVMWDDSYSENKAILANSKDKIIIATAMVRYSDYTGSNNLQSYKSSFLFKV